MANGDLAASIGLSVFPNTQDARLGYDNDNVRGDELANHILNGGHPVAKITGLPEALAGKSPVGHTHLVAEVTDLPTPSTGAEASTTAVRDTGGRLVVQEPTGPSHAASKNYVDAKVAGVVTTSARYASGPTPASYARTVSGSGFFQVWMDAGLEFGRNTSSRRYKDQVAPHYVDPAAVLALAPVSFHRKGTPDGVFDFGLIAEDVHDLVPELVTWHDGQVDGVRYDLLAVALLDTIRDLTDRVRHLEGS